MSENTETNWLDDLGDQIDELLADTKQVKFNTHKNRKAFAGKLKSLVKDAIYKNTLPLPDKFVRHSTPTITRPIPDKPKSKGFAVMTEDMSQAADDLAGRSPNANNPGHATTKIQEHNRGVGRW